MLTRRRFLATAACTLAAARLGAQGRNKTRITLTLPVEANGPHMPIDFIGLSYEVQQLADPSFFPGRTAAWFASSKRSRQPAFCALAATPASSPTGNPHPILRNQSTRKSVR
jgi:hypothetical protein